jgi:imidazolonepropionase
MTLRSFAAKRIVTCDPRRGGPLGAIDDGVIVVEGGLVRFVGAREDAPSDALIQELGDRVVTPGLIDAHTHACWVGSRHEEYAQRMAGRDYGDIARAGGGILSTHRAVVAATDVELVSVLGDRLRRMASLGVTTVEVKSGYGLDSVHEKRQLLAIHRAATLPGVPSVVPTLLALHALPPACSDRAAYVARVADEVVVEVARAGLARFVDAFVDAGAFSVEEALVVGDAARAAGLGIRLHVGQFADIGGAQLAATLRAASADHLEHVSRDGADAIARAGTSAVLLPLASFTLKQPAPPVTLLRAAGAPLVVASDANPGTAPTECRPRRRCSGRREMRRPPCAWKTGAFSARARVRMWPFGTSRTSEPSFSRGESKRRFLCSWRVERSR